MCGQPQINVDNGPHIDHVTDVLSLRVVIEIDAATLCHPGNRPSGYGVGFKGSLHQPLLATPAGALSCGLRLYAKDDFALILPHYLLHCNK